MHDRSASTLLLRLLRSMFVVGCIGDCHSWSDGIVLGQSALETEQLDQWREWFRYSILSVADNTFRTSSSKTTNNVSRKKLSFGTVRNILVGDERVLGSEPFRSIRLGCRRKRSEHCAYWMVLTAGQHSNEITIFYVEVVNIDRAEHEKADVNVRKRRVGLWQDSNPTALVVAHGVVRQASFGR